MRWHSAEHSFFRRIAFFKENYPEILRPFGKHIFSLFEGFLSCTSSCWSFPWCSSLSQSKAEEQEKSWECGYSMQRDFSSRGIYDMSVIEMPSTATAGTWKTATSRKVPPTRRHLPPSVGPDAVFSSLFLLLPGVFLRLWRGTWWCVPWCPQRIRCSPCHGTDLFCRVWFVMAFDCAFLGKLHGHLVQWCLWCSLCMQILLSQYAGRWSLLMRHFGVHWVTLTASAVCPLHSVGSLTPLASRLQKHVMIWEEWFLVCDQHAIDLLLPSVAWLYWAGVCHKEDGIRQK